MRLKCYRRMRRSVPTVRSEIVSEIDSMAGSLARIAYLLQLIIGGWLAMIVILRDII